MAASFFISTQLVTPKAKGVDGFLVLLARNCDTPGNQVITFFICATFGRLDQAITMLEFYVTPNKKPTHTTFFGGNSCSLFVAIK